MKKTITTLLLIIVPALILEVIDATIRDLCIAIVVLSPFCLTLIIQQAKSSFKSFIVEILDRKK
ncbi:hypothetical protein [Pseudalkalibacillus sp. JSM 102089]|uniref:hypothetical protein n=1 Tax=Pseudalkalibacillus sp. JSM 102089 TaxID=3229856 RepID=UPI00352629F6